MLTQPLIRITPLTHAAIFLRNLQAASRESQAPFSEHLQGSSSADAGMRQKQGTVSSGWWEAAGAQGEGVVVVLNDELARKRGDILNTPEIQTGRCGDPKQFAGPKTERCKTQNSGEWELEPLKVMSQRTLMSRLMRLDFTKWVPIRHLGE